MAFINEDTMEYPRFQGDIELNPNANWVEVESSDYPNELQEGNMWLEDTPIKVNGVWKQTWKQEPKPFHSKELEIKRAISLGIDIELLGLTYP